MVSGLHSVGVARSFWALRRKGTGSRRTVRGEAIADGAEADVVSDDARPATVGLSCRVNVGVVKQ